MIYLILLGIVIVSIYAIVAYKQSAIVNGLTLITAQLIFFNVIFPLLYEIYFRSNIDYKYIFIYYGVYFLFISFGYLFFSKTSKFNMNIFPSVESKNIKLVSNVMLIIVLAICLMIAVLVPVDYLKNPRVLYEKTRLGFGPLYFGITTLINIYFIFSMFSKKKYYYVIIAMILLYFTGSKVRMMLPLEMLFLYYFYVKLSDRKSFKKVLLLGSILIIAFMISYVVTSRFLPDKSISTVVKGLAGYSDYNRNFAKLVNKLLKSGKYFWGQISFENNFYSLIPRSLFPSKPTIFGSFKLSYMFFPKATLKYQGAPSFGAFGAIFADFGHLSLIIIAVYNFILGGLLAISEKNFIKHKNPISFMLFLIFTGISLIDVGLGSTTMIIINIVMVAALYYIVKFSHKFIKLKWLNKTD